MTSTGAMEKMTETIACAAGIDISKQHLEAHVQPGGQAKRFTNDKTGWRALAKWLIGCAPERIVYEATGPYHRGLERALSSAALPLVRVNPRRARRFAEAIGTSAKTDPVDARMLALYGLMLSPDVTPINSQTLEQLRELEAARRALVKARTAQTNRSKNLVSSLLKRQARATLKQINAQIRQIDQACRALISANPDLQRRLAILTSIPGLGETTAVTLIALMPELGRLDEKQVASLAGLAPIARESGQYRGKRFISGGRADLRQALYMPALVAIRFNDQMKRKYDALTQAGKPAKVAITAVMRKLIILANALIHHNRMWAQTAP